MAEKRRRGEDDTSDGRKTDVKKRKTGFSVGPANLPDGTYKRKTQKIKELLIQRAQIKKNYAKLKKQGNAPDASEALPQPASLAIEQQSPPAASAEPHPDRQSLIDEELETPAGAAAERRLDRDGTEARSRKRKPKAVPFKREYDQAQKRKAEVEERRRAREEAEKQRQEKLAERERFRRAMAKARTGGPNGQRKLGRESAVLLEKVKRMVG